LKPGDWLAWGKTNWDTPDKQDFAYWEAQVIAQPVRSGQEVIVLHNGEPYAVSKISSSKWGGLLLWRTCTGSTTTIRETQKALIKLDVADERPGFSAVRTGSAGVRPHFFGLLGASLTMTRIA
jgi:hypothetical protein